MSKEGVRSVIKEFGTQKKLATMLDTTQQNVALWVEQGFIPDCHAVNVALISSVPIADFVHPNIAELIRLARKN